MPRLQDLPLEWSLAGARPRGVISYGVLDSKSPRRLHRLFALEAFLCGATPWPASPETFALLPLLKPVGDFESCRFADWRNQAVTLSEAHCAATVYSRPGTTYVFLANLNKDAREVTCTLHPAAFPYPLARPETAAIVASSAAVAGPNAKGKALEKLDVRKLVGKGLRIELPGDGAILIQVSR